MLRPMPKWLAWLAAGGVAVAALAAVVFYQQVHDLQTEQVTPDVQVIYGLGSNVGVLRTERGSVVVDSMTFRSQGARIFERAQDFGGPLQALVNTHYHVDHTHGNPAFPVGTKVVSTERTLRYLEALDADYWQGDAAGTLPNETFRNAHELRVGEKTLRLLHPGRGHTDADLVVLFVEDKVLHAGDLFFNGRYPNIDLEAGGSVREWVATLDRVLELDFEHVIPGHGPVTDREGLRQFQSFMRQLAREGDRAAREGWSVDEMRERAELDADAGYEDFRIPLIMRLDRPFVLRRAWEEATGHFERVELPAETSREEETP